MVLYLRDLGLMESVGDHNIFPDLDRAMEAAENRLIRKFIPEATPDRGPLDFSRFALLKDMTPEDLVKVQAIMQKRQYDAGETIFEAGEPGDTVYMIGSGCVSILGSSGTDMDTRFTSLGPGLYFGEMALLERSDRSARAVADEDCELYAIHMDDIEELIQEDVHVGTRLVHAMARGLSQRLRLVSAELSAIESM